MIATIGPSCTTAENAAPASCPKNRRDATAMWAVLTRLKKPNSINYPPKTSQFDVNFAISVGVEYKFKKKR